ncbi:MAG: hypothetical protein GY820_14735 [Gammaproteobacteria bacterium]|nr:hypothetical protein [Gammaproteobacteria bacterium]
MSRPLRIHYENATYHVMNQGRGRQKVFYNVDYYQAFLQCLDEVNKRFPAEIQAYCHQICRSILPDRRNRAY